MIRVQNLLSRFKLLLEWKTTSLVKSLFTTSALKVSGLYTNTTLCPCMYMYNTYKIIPSLVAYSDHCCAITFKHFMHKDLHLDIHTVMFTGRTSEGSSLTTLLVTISCVLTAAMVVGSVLFAVTMWRVRAHGRQHASNAGSKAKRIFMTILCPCRRRAASCSTAQTGRDGLQLSTIQARDKNKQLIALHLARHVQNARRVDEGTRLNKPSQPSAKRRRTDDLPYGYVSPADINIPQFRRENKFSASEGGPQPQTHQKAANELKYTASEGGISQLVREKSTDEIISQSESLYSTPCSLTSSMEEYENTQNYLTILPP